MTSSVGSGALAHDYPWLQPGNYDPEQTIERQIPPPEGFTRIAVREKGFAAWLRGLPLKPAGSHIELHDGTVHYSQDAHIAVVDMDVMRFQECADTAIRLLAEYLWSAGRRDGIAFTFTSGDVCSWKKWRNGWYPHNNEGHIVWKQDGVRSDTREHFLDYLDKVMEYAGTYSLKRDLLPVEPGELQIGDVIVQAGSPGHAVIVLDIAENDSGEKIMLLGQGFIPAQDLHVLKNPNGEEAPWFERTLNRIFERDMMGQCSWYKTKFNNYLITPQWRFSADGCRRFHFHSNSQ